MDKEHIIALIEGQLATGKISKKDLLDIVNAGQGHIEAVSAVHIAPESATSAKEESSKNLINVFYVIGAIIALIGVVILIVQHWSDIGFAGRILVTLGFSFATYVAGLLFRRPEQKMISQVMFTLSAGLAPTGLYILLNEAHVDFSSNMQILIAFVLSVIYGVALFVSKRNILVLLTVGFLSWAYFAVVIKIFGQVHTDEDVLKWASMLLGASYILVAYGYGASWMASDESDGREKKSIQNVLYSLGALGILGAGIFVGGLFDLFFIALIFGAFYGGVYLKSRGMLTLGALFLMAHIIKLTSKYFVDSIGWPVALIAVGFLVIGVGYMTFYLNKKFISNT